MTITILQGIAMATLGWGLWIAVHHWRKCGFAWWPAMLLIVMLANVAIQFVPFVPSPFYWMAWIVYVLAMIAYVVSGMHWLRLRWPGRSPRRSKQSESDTSSGDELATLILYALLTMDSDNHYEHSNESLTIDGSAEQLVDETLWIGQESEDSSNDEKTQ